MTTILTTVIISLALTLIGIGAGFMLGRAFTLRRLNKSDWLDSLFYQSQNLLMMYLIQDEMYRKRLDKWAGTYQAQEFAEIIYGGANGKLFLLPFNDRDKMKVIIEDLRKVYDENGTTQ